MPGISASDVIISAIIGIGTGIASALITWWYLTRYLRPQCKLDEKLSHYQLGEEPVARSQVRLHVGKRSLVEATITITVRIPALIATKSVEVLRVASFESPFLAADARPRWRVSLHRMPPDTYERYASWLGPWRDAIERKQPIDVREFLASYDGSQVVVTVLARDAYTGAPGVVRRSYDVSDFYDGRFPNVDEVDDAGSALPDAPDPPGRPSVVTTQREASS